LDMSPYYAGTRPVCTALSEKWSEFPQGHCPEGLKNK
jgi:hypothetical protein